jgi:hypothetical protein
MILEDGLWTGWLGADRLEPTSSASASRQLQSAIRNLLAAYSNAF